MKFNIKDAKNNINGPITGDPSIDIRIVDAIDYSSFIAYYIRKKYDELFNMSINQYKTNISTIFIMIELHKKNINRVITAEKLSKVRYLLGKQNVPSSVTVTGYKYTNIGIAFRFDTLMVKVINVLESINDEVLYIINNNNNYDASIKLDNFYEKIIRNIKEDDYDIFKNMTLYGFADPKIKKFNPEYFRDGSIEPFEIVVSKDEYYNVYRSLEEYKKYYDNLNKYTISLDKMSKVIFKTLYDNTIKYRFNELESGSDLKKSLTKIILAEGRFLGSVSVLICNFLQFQTDAINQSLAQNINIINTINSKTTD